MLALPASADFGRRSETRGRARSVPLNSSVACGKRVSEWHHRAAAFAAWRALEAMPNARPFRGYWSAIRLPSKHPIKRGGSVSGLRFRQSLSKSRRAEQPTANPAISFARRSIPTVRGPRNIALGSSTWIGLSTSRAPVSMLAAIRR